MGVAQSWTRRSDEHFHFQRLRCMQPGPLGSAGGMWVLTPVRSCWQEPALPHGMLSFQWEGAAPITGSPGVSRGLPAFPQRASQGRGPAGAATAAPRQALEPLSLCVMILVV